MKLSLEDITKIPDSLLIDGDHFELKYESGKTKLEGGFKNSNLNGEIKLFYQSGKVGLICSYKNNFLNGQERHYYDSGGIKAIRCFDNGKLNGAFKLFFEDGKRKSMGCYVENRLHDKYISYYESGGFEIVCSYLDGKLNGAYKEYYESGKVKVDRFYKKDVIFGEIREYLESGVAKDANSVYFLKKNKGNFVDSNADLSESEDVDKFLKSILGNIIKRRQAVEESELAKRKKSEKQSCSKCFVERPVSEFLDSKLKSVVHSLCKRCREEKLISSKAKQKQKKCTKCGETKAIDNFRFRATRNYFESACKLCEQKGLTGRRRPIRGEVEAIVPSSGNGKLELIEKCIHEKRIIEISYQAKYGRRMNRKIKPIRLTGSLLRAYCYLRSDERTFNVGKIIILNSKI